MSSTEWDENRKFLKSGEISFYLPIEPVSLQANRKKKEVITSKIRGITSNYNFILTDDVQIYIEWHVRKQKRYESDASPDVDNIIKPILDALCGPKGILINDCQVQAISCNWLDLDCNDRIVIRIRMFRNDEWLLKNGLTFVHMGKGLCYPIILNNTSPQVSLILIEELERKLTARDKLMAIGVDYYQTEGIMSVQRIFHISRVQEFEVFELADLKSMLLNQTKRESNS